MREDSPDLLGIGDEGEDPHLGSTAQAAQRIDFVDLCEQPCPSSTGLHGGHGQIGPVLVDLAEAEGGLLLVLRLPSFWSQAE